MTQAPSPAKFFIGIDIGGTFTDVILADQDSHNLFTAKKLTTHDNPAEAVLEGMVDVMEQAGIGASEVVRVVHATTLATNLILEGKGARIGYITTVGFGDLLQLGWGIRAGPDRYDLLIPKAATPVDRTMTIEARERLDRHGNVVVPLDETHLAEEINKLSRQGPAAYAVCLLHSYANPAHERRVLEIIHREQPDAYVALSSEVWPEFREYERATTAVMSATVGPLMSHYLNRLQQALIDEGVRVPLQIMQSNGGVMPAFIVATKPIQSVESGPAAGVIGAAHAGGLYGCKDIICFDMGGTTAKAGLVRDGKPRIVHGFRVGGKVSFVGGRRAGGGFPVKIPTIDLAEVGAGGGSIAWVDLGGVLQVGPNSASSLPGPACYNRGGTEPTVTDADLTLGYLNPNYFLGGKLRVYPELARAAIEDRIATPLGMDVISAASGIYEIVNANMAAAVRLVTVERGIDPSDFSVIAFGGAGPAHIVGVMEELNVRSIIIPTTPGLASAAGLLVTDMTADYVRTRVMDADSIDVNDANTILEDLEQGGIAKMRREGLADKDIEVEREIGARFRGQAHELPVPVPPGSLTDEDLIQVQQDFREIYANVYGVKQPNPVQLVNFRVRIVGQMPKLKLRRSIASDMNPVSALKNSRPVYFRCVGAFVETPVYNRQKLAAGNGFTGPAVVEEPDSTTIIPPGYQVNVGDYLQLVVQKM